jgi:hypothetical protein
LAHFGTSSDRLPADADAVLDRVALRHGPFDALLYRVWFGADLERRLERRAVRDLATEGGAELRPVVRVDLRVMPTA